MFRHSRVTITPLRRFKFELRKIMRTVLHAQQLQGTHDLSTRLALVPEDNGARRLNSLHCVLVLVVSARSWVLTLCRPFVYTGCLLGELVPDA